MSKKCASYAQNCESKCCDANGECPESSGQPCKWSYETGTDTTGAAVSAATTSGAVAATQDTSTTSSAAGSAQSETASTTKTTVKKTTETKILRVPAKSSEAAPMGGIAPSSDPVPTQSSGPVRSDVKLRRSSGSGREYAAKSIGGADRPVESSTPIILWTLLGLTLGLVALSLLYLCCRRRFSYGGYPGMYQPGLYGGMVPGVGGMMPGMMPGAMTGVVPGTAFPGMAATPIPPPGVANAAAAATSGAVGAGIAGSLAPPVPNFTRTGSVVYGGPRM